MNLNDSSEPDSNYNITNSDSNEILDQQIYTIILVLFFIFCFYIKFSAFNIFGKIKNIIYNFKKKTSLSETLYINTEVSECSICLERFEVNTNVCILECGHIYHKNCISSWFNINHSCPTCRFEI